MTIHVVIADDHRVVRDGLRYLLSQEPDIDVVGEAGDGRQAVTVVAATCPEVVLLDLYMPELDGHGVLAALRDTPHHPAVVVLTSATDDEHLVRAMHAGATSYLLKTAPAEHVVNAVRDAAAGTATLSPDLLTRLTQALRLPATGPATTALTARTRGPSPHRARPQQPADRPRAGDRRADRQDARQQHPHQARSARPRPGGDLRPPPPGRQPRTPAVIDLRGSLPVTLCRRISPARVRKSPSRTSVPRCPRDPDATQPLLPVRGTACGAGCRAAAAPARRCVRDAQRRV